MPNNHFTKLFESSVAFKNIPGLFYCLFSVYSNKHNNFYKNICEKLSIQYLVPGFEPTTSWT